MLHSNNFLVPAVPQTLESIYIRTLRLGEFVTCDVKGTPPPAVKWIIPENISASLVSVQSSFTTASSSIPAILPNTNYTCEIRGENGLQHLSVYYSRAQERQCRIPFPLFIVFVVLFGISLIFLVTLGVFYKIGKEWGNLLFTAPFLNACVFSPCAQIFKCLNS